MTGEGRGEATSSDDGTGTFVSRSTPRPDDAADALAVAICQLIQDN